ncbi:hypothetical protein M1585_04285 [Candidatus Parvarchaeota archaeon]|nr:hypothetical protein [Candidatus Parvarchaeota archaeon]
MEEEIKQLYDAVLKLNEKISQVNSKNNQLESLINSMSQYILEKNEGDITEQEIVVLDPFNIGGYKNVSTANGSVLKVRSKGLCVNGRHSVDETTPVILCSKCNGIICEKHDKGLNPPMCVNCIKDQIKDLELLDIYILNAVNTGLNLNELRKIVKGSYREFNSSQQRLIKEGYLERDLLFRKILTTKGASALALGSKVYDLSFMQ